jgi:hypothetical protein
MRPTHRGEMLAAVVGFGSLVVLLTIVTLAVFYAASSR